MLKVEMNTSTQSAGEPSLLDPVYGLRDDLASHFNPINAFERLLVTAAAQALRRYQDAQKLERRLFEKVDPLELLTNQPDTFKMITRHVESCERAWRKALEEIRRAIRQREKTPDSASARKASQRPAAPPPAAVLNTPQSPLAPVHARRE
jgi:hypothetical protein